MNKAGKPESIEESIRSTAIELGFSLCRFTTAAPPASGPRFSEWLAAGHQGEMSYLARNAPKRLDPNLVLPGVQSVVMLAASYHREPDVEPTAKSPSGNPLRGTVARYARHEDYHDRLGSKLKELTRFIDAQAGEGTRSLWYVDTGPILERDLAERAGIGFVGKHTNVISRELGNWFLISEILTTARLVPDAPERNRCGNCSRCISACPTGAILRPFELDARRCISYLTIELKGSIPEPLRPAIGNRIFGCDDCLAVCPWNRFASEGRIMKEAVRPELDQPDLLEWLQLSEETFRSRFTGTPLLRSKRRGLLRNVCVALGNVGDRGALPELQRASQDPEPLIAEHALWAIRQIEAREAK